MCEEITKKELSFFLALKLICSPFHLTIGGKCWGLLSISVGENVSAILTYNSMDVILTWLIVFLFFLLNDY